VGILPCWCHSQRTGTGPGWSTGCFSYLQALWFHARTYV
jgi:hypothetical protein